MPQDSAGGHEEAVAIFHVFCLGFESSLSNSFLSVLKIQKHHTGKRQLAAECWGTPGEG